jgi:hypothetical protein
VTIPISSSDENEGIVGQSAVTFTRDNWNAPQTVTVTGVNDGERDGDVQYEIEIGAAESNDDDYDGLNADDITVTNRDDDSAGVKVTGAANLQTTVESGTATFTVELLSHPSANVTIALASSDATEGTVAPLQLVFTTTNWASPQTATVTGVADDELDGAVAYKIVTTATSTDASYNGIEVADVDVRLFAHRADDRAELALREVGRAAHALDLTDDAVDAGLRSPWAHDDDHWT